MLNKLKDNVQNPFLWFVLIGFIGTTAVQRYKVEQLEQRMNRYVRRISTLEDKIDELRIEDAKKTTKIEIFEKIMFNNFKFKKDENNLEN